MIYWSNEFPQSQTCLTCALSFPEFSERDLLFPVLLKYEILTQGFRTTMSSLFVLDLSGAVA